MSKPTEEKPVAELTTDELARELMARCNSIIIVANVPDDGGESDAIVWRQGAYSSVIGLATMAKEAITREWRRKLKG
jgi:hypothetical protein